jgi:murein DD-endopeptidase MepM/ murein hydrolase activator NlpD
MNKKPLLVALFFLIGSVAIWAFLPSSHGFVGIFGGPNTKNSQSGAEKNELALLYKVPNPAGSAPKTIRVSESADASYLLSNSVDGPNLDPSASGYVDYKVAKGDTLFGIAKSFGISIETISAANPKVRGRALKAGEVLKILPMTGFVYLIKDGESIESVASKYGLSLSQLLAFNSGADLSVIGAGSPIIIPGNPRNLEESELPDLKSYFSLPAKGLNWGSLHNYNAVDIANVCGTEVVSSADGLVTEVGLPEENNGGYGGYILIEHSNNTKTRYAHLGKLEVDMGQYVKKGSEIGEIGNSGTVHGPSGCHLHFEVYGAQNPFRKN